MISFDLADWYRSLQKHVLVAVDDNGRGMFRATCRCGHTEYASAPAAARDKLARHIGEEAIR